jgi:hypothetical protein
MSHLFQIFPVGRLEVGILAEGFKGNLIQGVVVPAKEDFPFLQNPFSDIDGKLLENARVYRELGSIFQFYFREFQCRIRIRHENQNVIL